jgi:sulfur-carrier protein
MIKVLFFAALREQLGSEQITIPVEEPATIADVIDALLALNPQWQSAFSQSLLCAVNQNMVSREHPVNAGDEVAFFPPVTGG